MIFQKILMDSLLIKISFLLLGIFSLQAQNTDPSYKFAGAAMRNSSAVQDDYMQVLTCYDTTVLNVLANDDIINQCSINNIVLAITGGSVAGATATVNNNKNIVYLPAPGFIGRDTLTYIAGCNLTEMHVAKVFITVVECPDNITVANCSGAPPATEWGIRELARSTVSVNPSAQLLIGDVDGCGKNEIVTFAESYNLQNWTNEVLIFDDKLELKSSFSIDDSHIYPISTNAIADVDFCGKAEIFILEGTHATLTRTLNCYAFNGIDYVKKIGFNPIIIELANYAMTPTISIGDINGDGIPELFVYNSIYNAQTGALIGTLPPGGSIGSWSNVEWILMPVLADVDNDGILEIVCGNMVYKALINEGSTALISPITVAYQAPVGIDIKDGLTSVADIDLDGYLDVVVTVSDYYHAQMYVWNPYKEILLCDPIILTDFESEMVSRAFIGDVDNDGYPEITLVFRLGMACFKYYPDNPPANRISELWRQPTNDLLGWFSMSLFDFNQDGKQEIVFRDMYNFRILDGATGLDINTIESLSFPSYTAPVIVDFTGEGNAQILIQSYTDFMSPPTIHLYGSSIPGAWAPARKVWNQLGYNSININEDLTVPRFQMNPATVFPGPDGILGTADDIRPFNNFLQQQTLLNQNGVPFFTMPNIVWIAQPTMTINNDTAVFEGCIKNIGDAALQAPIYFTYYKNDTIIANIIALDSIQSTLAAGDTLCFTFSIHNWSAHAPVNRVWVSANDRNGVYPYQAQCMTDGRRIAMDEEIQNYAAFYANNVHHESLGDTVFCNKNVHFQADVENYTEIKWYIGEEEQFPDDPLQWSKEFSNGFFTITMWVRFENDDEIEILGELRMEILWIKIRNVRY